MYVSFHPEYTKKTRCDNNLKSDNNRNTDFFRPMLSNPQVPMTYNHESYYYDNNMYNQTNSYNNNFDNMDIERSSLSTRNNIASSRKPVQTNFQNDYYTMNYDTLNNSLNSMNDVDANKYLTRNPVNTRRDMLEKERNLDKQEFMRTQGGYLNNIPEFNYQSTRKGKPQINSSNYIPMPCTRAIPKENI